MSGADLVDMPHPLLPNKCDRKQGKSNLCGYLHVKIFFVGTSPTRYCNTTITGPDNDWLGHLRARESFFIIAIRHGWKFKVSKIRIAYPEIKILRVIVFSHGKRADPTQIDALLSMRTPQNALEVRSFVGLARASTPFVSQLASPSEKPSAPIEV